MKVDLIYFKWGQQILIKISVSKYWLRIILKNNSFFGGRMEIFKIQKFDFWCHSKRDYGDPHRNVEPRWSHFYHSVGVLYSVKWALTTRSESDHLTHLTAGQLVCYSWKPFLVFGRFDCWRDRPCEIHFVWELKNAHLSISKR